MVIIYYYKNTDRVGPLVFFFRFSHLLKKRLQSLHYNFIDIMLRVTYMLAEFTTRLKRNKIIK